MGNDFTEKLKKQSPAIKKAIILLALGLLAIPLGWLVVYKAQKRMAKQNDFQMFEGLDLDMDNLSTNLEELVPTSTPTTSPQE